MSVKEYQVDIYTGVKHRIGTKRHLNYREKLEKDLKKYNLQDLKKKIEEKKNRDIDCIVPCKEDEVCNRKSGKCVKRTSKYGIGILRKEKEEVLKEFRPELWDVIDMPKDNHCGYHAFIFACKSLLKNQSKFDFNKPVKDLILELKSILIKSYKERGDGNNYNRILNNSNNWLEDRDLQILANYFNIIIIVYDERMNTYKNNLFTEISPTPKKGQLEKIYLFQTINHYDVMFLKNNERNLDIEQPTNIFITDDDLRHYLKEKGIISTEYYLNEESTIQKGNTMIEKETIENEIEEEESPILESESMIISRTPHKTDIISRKILSNEEIKKILKKKINLKKIDKLKNFVQ